MASKFAKKPTNKPHTVRTYKYDLILNQIEKVGLQYVLQTCQRFYNAALEERISAYKQYTEELDKRGLYHYESVQKTSKKVPKKSKKTPVQASPVELHEVKKIYDHTSPEAKELKKKYEVNYYTQAAALTLIRAEDQVINALPRHMLNAVLYKLDLAFNAFFKRCKTGQTPGFPRFKGIHQFKSFEFRHPLKIENSAGVSQVHIPNLGWVRFNQYRPLRGVVKSVYFRLQQSGKWTVNFSVDLGGTPEKIPLDLIPDNQIVGGDLGLNILLYLSNDEKIERVRFTKNSEKKLAKQQRKLSRKKKGSNGYKRQRALVAKTNDRIANQRLDYLRKVAVYLVLHYKLIFLEDLNVKGMVQGLNYGKSIYDAAWSLLVSLVQFKAESAGSWVVKVDPRDTSQDCSGCGKLVPKDLTVRIHSCPYCGLILDRDLNAAMNIRSRGLRELGLSVSTTDEPRSACID